MVDDPFRVRKAAKRGLSRKETTQDGVEIEGALDKALPLSRVPLRDMPGLRNELSTHGLGESNMPRDKPAQPSEAVRAGAGQISGQFQMWDPDDEDEDTLVAAAMEEESRIEKEKRQERNRKDDGLSGGVAAALAKLREKG